MIARLPSLRAQAVIRALERGGFVIVRAKGSHHILEHVDDPRRRTTVPLHKGKDLPCGLLLKIIADAKLTTRSFGPCCKAGRV